MFTTLSPFCVIGCSRQVVWSRRTVCHRLAQRGYDRLDIPVLSSNHKTERVTIKLSRAIDFVLRGSLSVENAIGSLLEASLIKAPWDRGSPSLAPPAPLRMLHGQRFFFIAPWAIAFALSCVYGRSLLTG